MNKYSVRYGLLQTALCGLFSGIDMIFSEPMSGGVIPGYFYVIFVYIYQLICFSHYRKTIILQNFSFLSVIKVSLFSSLISALSFSSLSYLFLQYYFYKYLDAFLENYRHGLENAGLSVERINNVISNFDPNDTIVMVSVGSLFLIPVLNVLTSLLVAPFVTKTAADLP